jgi:hypothetical protein
VFKVFVDKNVGRFNFPHRGIFLEPPLMVFTDMERDVYDMVVSMSSVVAEFHTVSYTQIESSSCLIPEVVWEVKGGVKLPLN